MAKTNPAKTIQKLRTDEEMLQAIVAIHNGSSKISTVSQDDDTDVIVCDMRAELLEARKTIEEFRGFVSVQYPKLTARK